jgi:hypothetical protein
MTFTCTTTSRLYIQAGSQNILLLRLVLPVNPFLVKSIIVYCSRVQAHCINNLVVLFATSDLATYHGNGMAYCDYSYCVMCVSDRVLVHLVIGLTEGEWKLLSFISFCVVYCFFFSVFRLHFLFSSCPRFRTMRDRDMITSARERIWTPLPLVVFYTVIY